MVEAMTQFGANVDGAVIRRGDGLAVVSTRLSFLLFNQIIVEGAAATPAALTAGVALMRERGSPFVVNLRVGADDRFVAFLGEIGLEPLSERPWIPGMALHPVLSGPSSEMPKNHVIRQVADRSGLEDHIQTAAAGFELPEEILRAVLVADVIGRQGITIYVGYTDGRPVSTGAGIRSGSTIGVYNIATLASARGRGYGAAMTRRVAADGAAAGCDVAILQSSEMGFPIYERLGYRTVVEYMGYVERPPP